MSTVRIACLNMGYHQDRKTKIVFNETAVRVPGIGDVFVGVADVPVEIWENDFSRRKTGDPDRPCYYTPIEPVARQVSDEEEAAAAAAVAKANEQMMAEQAELLRKANEARQEEEVAEAARKAKELEQAQADLVKKTKNKPKE